jgi:hypothetical protein
MRPSIFAIALAASGAPIALAFTSQNALSRHHATRLSVGSETTPSATKPIEEGSHDELMYALGINLARQLGDIRPLVENSEELTQVARGLLDAVVGKADEMAQREILQRRGDELSATIVERA